MIYLERFEEKVKVFKEEEKAAYELAKQQHPDEIADVEKDWLAYKNSDVIPHFPPQLVIGK